MSADTYDMGSNGFEQWARMLGWQTQVLLEREGYDVGPLPRVNPRAATASSPTKRGWRFGLLPRRSGPPDR